MPSTTKETSRSRQRRASAVTIRHTNLPDYTDIDGNPFPPPGDRMITASVMLTPEMAEDFATRPLPVFDDGEPVRQRKSSESHIKTIMGWIQRGEWVESPEGLAFTPTGGMLEGLQRCKAVIRTRKSVPVRITFNVPTAVFPILNLGKKRSSRDLAEMSGVEKYATIFSSGIKLVYVALEYEKDPEEFVDWTWWSRVPMSSTQQMETQKYHAGIGEPLPDGRAGLAHWLIDAYRMRHDADCVDGAAATWLYLAERAWPDAVTRRIIRSGNGEDEKVVEEGPLIDFRDQVIEGVLIDKGDPAHTLRRWLSVGAGSTWDARFKRQAHLWALIHAWNAFCRKEELKHGEIRPVRPNGMVVPMPTLYRPE